MQDVWNVVLKILEYAAAVGAGLAAINKWVVSPLKDLMKGQREKLEAIEKTVQTSQDDIVDLLGNELEREHERLVNRGWCSVSEKRRYADMTAKYHERGKNHIGPHLEKEVLALPDSPQ